jgi:signal transduction histidine kinase
LTAPRLVSSKFRKQDLPPKIEISANNETGRWIFCVEDNGIGISPEHFENIFGIFYRLHGKSEYPGSGIGLSLCKRIIERHGGEIWVKSTLGEGTRFFFTLSKIN